MPRHVRHLTAFASLAAAACTTLGERAATGACPVGETCSPATPAGLAFAGPSLADLPFDSHMHPTAAGGTQTLGVYEAGSGAALDQPFRATIDAPFTVEAVEVPRATVAVRAAAAGTATLRITAPDGTLYDRLAVRAIAVTSIGLRSRDEALRADLGVAAAPGRAVPLVVTLSGDGFRLIDEGMTLTVDDAPVPDASWQVATVVSPAVGALELVATTSAGERRAFTLTAATALDRLELLPHEPLVPGQGGVVCGVAISGDDQVVGETWTWASVDADLFSGLVQRNCIGVVPRRAGPLTLVADVGGHTATFSIDAVAAARPAAAPPVADGLGDRAALALDAE